MDFASADRSGDSEFQAQVKNYNFGVAEQNRQITKDIKTDKDNEKTAEKDIDNTELMTQLKDATTQATGTAGAGATFNKIAEAKKAGKSVASTLSDAQKKATATGEARQQSAPSEEVPAEPVPAEPPTKPPLGGAPVIEEGGTDAGKVAGKVGGKVGGLAGAGEEGAGLLSRVGGKALKGVGVVGAIAGMGMAISADENGGWHKMSTADKLGNMAEIGGAGMDIVGTALEATPLAPIGLALQGFGTLFQLGAGIEGEISSAQSVDPAKKKAQADAKKAEDAEAKPVAQEAVVSQAQTGNLGVAQEAQ